MSIWRRVFGDGRPSNAKMAYRTEALAFLELKSAALAGVEVSGDALARAKERRRPAGTPQRMGRHGERERLSIAMPTRIGPRRRVGLHASYVTNML